MERRRAGDGIPGQGKALRRRGLIAGAAALVAGIVAKQVSEPVAAVAGGTNGTALILGANGFLGNTPNAGNTTALFAATNASGNYTYDAGDSFVVVGSKTGAAIRAFSDQGQGIYGSSQSGIGVEGLVTGSATNTVAVQGVNQSTGPGGFGIQGQINSGPAANTIGVYGVNYSTGANTTGVYGAASVGNGVVGATYGAGVLAGVYGYSNSAYGVIGSTTATGYSGLTAITGTAGVAALAATATVNTAYAAYFQGSTVVQGDFAVVGGNKSAAVKDASGQHRLVYCMESPESWFEDFGSGKLVGGKASVALDKTFTEIAHTDDFHVHLTPQGDTNGLHVVSQSATGFVVAENKSGASTVGFRWRVVAKRKDITGERLAKFDLPKIHIPDESKLQRPDPPRGAPSPLPPTKP